uniref:NADH-ubiquinone oxidoreductase chain 6 n=1 Tax=Pseudocolochirus violaceus TaxID=2528974 RepID=A0A7G7YDQ4_9ECHN|nr:NADH dehydrogenase subunit 6 [Pseudocolochirus violaceus]QNH92624.1 NADH dehydrogenase subunit 6 [Pseudocolochirus violaceus]
MVFYFFTIFLLLGSTMVFYSLSPYYAALGLALVTLLGCIVLGFCGVSFLALLLLLIYMGGMLVVFVYSSALSADRFPVVSNLGEVLVLFSLMCFWVFFIFEDFLEFGIFLSFVGVQDLLGLGELYGYGGLYLLVGGLALLVVLIVALVISFSFSEVSLRAL